MIRFLYGGVGLIMVGWSVLVVAISLTGYRRGERCAWYSMWSLPVLWVIMALVTVGFGDVSMALEWALFVIVSLLGLLLPYRKFFPR